jgi:glycosyltransferase involved in cell wall biosynthesis
MGHLSQFKGVDIVLEVFRRLVREIPNLELTLASNGLDYGDGIRHLVDDAVEEFPRQVTLKGRVNPYQELGRAHLLIYPFRFQAGTFAFPLSLYEALLCGTPFLSSDLDGSNEFFDRAFLCPPGDVDAFTARAAQLIQGGEKIQEMIKSNLTRIHDKCLVQRKNQQVPSLA